jgi:alginate O-acetyltransferase complex protein AlgI
MLFNSYGFIFLFLPITFLGTLWLGKRTQHGAVLWLGLTSLLFYSFWNPVFVGLLLGTIIFNYLVANQLRASVQWSNIQYKDYLLAAAITANLLALGYFKYANFFITIVSEGTGIAIQPLEIILPLGISFFTFTQIAFLVDVSRGFAQEQNFLRYLLFVTYFPHLIAGPVLHHKQMMPQFSEPANFRFNSENVCVGLSIFILGLAKKVFLADSFGEIANPIFDASSTSNKLQFFEAWVGALSYTLQLYFDFSAYSDMAIGLSLIFNIRLPLNFNSPFKATSVIEFWQRWHMSLTKYIGEYLYTPISLKLMRFGLGKPFLIETTYILVIPTAITFFIIGLWHGANYTFIAFGVIHGAYLIINHWWRALKKKIGIRHQGTPLSRFFSCILTYFCVVIALVFFRSDTLDDAIRLCHAMFGQNGISLPETIKPIFSFISSGIHGVGISFDGIFQNKLFNQPHWYILAFLVTGHAIVWLLPNIHEIMSNHKICCEDLDVRPTKKIKQTASYSWHQKLIWRPTFLWASSLGMLFFATLLAMASNKPSSFLYYQF